MYTMLQAGGGRLAAKIASARLASRSALKSTTVLDAQFMRLSSLPIRNSVTCALSSKSAQTTSASLHTLSRRSLASSSRVHSGPSKKAWPSSSNQGARFMSVNLGPKFDTTANAPRSRLYWGKLFGRYGGIFGLGRLTPLILAAIAGGAYFWSEDYGESALVDEPPFVTPEAEQLWSDNAVRIVSMLPTRLGSQIWGVLTHMTVPVALREHIYGLYANTFNVIMNEVPKPLSEFESLNAFFTRRISTADHRPVAPTEFVSPVDGTMLVYGDCKDVWSEQVKGIYYNLETLLGADALSMINSFAKRPKRDGSCPDLKYCVIYLAPGDYHGIHAPVEWNIKDVRHFPGHLFSVSPATSARLRGLLAVNERVCLSGTSPYGFFSMTPVGAYNVGSITLEWDDSFDTNLFEQQIGEVYQIQYQEEIMADKGDCVSFFNLGSTVVLLFEAPKDFKWKVQPHDKLKLGQPLFGTR